MGHTSGSADARPVQSSEQRAFLAAGLAVIAAGLMLVLAGFAWGQFVFISERPFQLMQQEAVQSLNAELPGGIQISSAQYVAPTYLQTSLSQPPTWLGGLAVFVGACMLLGSAPGTVASPPSAAQRPVESPTESDALFIVDE